MSRKFSHLWKEFARTARESLKGVPDGQREQKMRELAGGRDINSVRRALSAYEFLQRWIVEQPQAASDLYDAPQSIVEVISRWSRFDEPGAIRAVRRWHAERMPFEKLNLEMKLARNEIGMFPGKMLENEYRKKLTSVVENIVLGSVTGDLTRPAVNYKEGDDPAVDFRFLEVDPQRKTAVRSIACLIVGPYRNLDLYKKRRLDWMCRAFALAWIHDIVLLILPDSNFIDAYEKWTSDFTHRSKSMGPESQRYPNVRIVSPLSPEDQAALASLAN